MERFTKAQLISLIDNYIDFNRKRPTISDLAGYINDGLIFISYDTYHTLKVTE